MSKKTSTIDKCIETVEYLIIPAAGVAAIWGFDTSAYVAAVAAFIIAGLKCVKVFIK